MFAKEKGRNEQCILVSTCMIEQLSNGRVVVNVVQGNP
jgi:hypothetical protein